MWRWRPVFPQCNQVVIQMRNMKIKNLTPEFLPKMDAYWREVNYLSVGQIYLYENPMLK